jgi:hypothetical protein
MCADEIRDPTAFYIFLALVGLFAYQFMLALAEHRNQKWKNK